MRRRRPVERPLQAAAAQQIAWIEGSRVGTRRNRSNLERNLDRIAMLKLRRGSEAPHATPAAGDCVLFLFCATEARRGLEPELDEVADTWARHTTRGGAEGGCEREEEGVIRRPS